MGYQLGSGVFNPISLDMNIGIYVARATAGLPASTDDALFTVADGDVLITHLSGEVTTVIQTQANDTKLKFNPDATGADVDLCAALDITGDAVGTRYSLTGTVTDAMTERLNCLTAADVLTAPLVLSEGDIEIDCAATNTGSVAWYCVYVPLTTGATVTAA